MPNNNTTVVSYYKIKKAWLWLSVVALLIITIATGILCYNKGFKDNQSYGSDGTPIVCVTKSGSKYHKRNCKYLTYSSIEISQGQAENKGYSPCSKCKPERN